MFQTTSKFFLKFSVLWKITPPYLFRSNVIYFAQKGPIKVQFLRLSNAWIKIHQILLFLKQQIDFFFQILHHSSVSWDITPLFFFSWNWVYIFSTEGTYQSTNLVKIHVSSQNSEILHFHGFLLSKSCKVSAKKVQKSYLSLHWRVMQSLKKNWLVVSNMTSGIWWIFTQPIKSLKILLWWALFIQSI